MSAPLDRRLANQSLLASALFPSLGAKRAPAPLKMARFTCEVNPPLGHPCMGGGISPVKRYEDPLEARGVVLSWDNEKPVVLVSVDWCEIRHTAHDAWRNALAKAVQTDPLRVLVSSVHQHDAPVADLRAEEILRKANAPGSVCNPEFHAQTVERVAREAAKATQEWIEVTRISACKTEIGAIASNRRYLDREGKPRFDRGSATRDDFARQAPPGAIDPLLKMIRLEGAKGEAVTLFHYATHPMSYYGQGAVSADFIGLGRRAFERRHPDSFPIYFSGCSGNVTAGKFNMGDPANRPVLGQKLAAGMEAALGAAKPIPLRTPQFRAIPFSLPFRKDPAFTVEAMQDRLKANRTFHQCLAAMGLSCRERLERPLDLPILDFGMAAFLLAPAESYVEFQLHANLVRPDATILTAGYGESAPGYIPTEKAWQENDSNLGDWCWVNRGSEAPLKEAISRALSSTKP